jgi:hypothetical protein
MFLQEVPSDLLKNEFRKTGSIQFGVRVYAIGYMIVQVLFAPPHRQLCPASKCDIPVSARCKP